MAPLLMLHPLGILVVSGKIHMIAAVKEGFTQCRRNTFEYSQKIDRKIISPCVNFQCRLDVTIAEVSVNIFSNKSPNVAPKVNHSANGGLLRTSRANYPFFR